MMNSGQVIGIGVDLVKVSRIEQAVNRSERFVERNFTGAELEYCYSKPEPFSYLAARFAAKEAVTKALRTTIRMQDVEVVHGDNGAPEVCLHGKTLEEFPNITFLISLSHEDEYAIAQCIALK